MFDYPTTQFIIGTIFASYLMAFKLKKIPTSIIGIMSSQFKSEAEREDAKHFSEIGFWASIISGILATSIGLILILVSKDWNCDLLGVNLAISIMPLVYSSILSILFVCAKFRAIRGKVIP